jgi:hypothetical protein
LPLVVLADDWFSHEVYMTVNLANTGSLYKTASWHNVMAVLYSSIVRSASVLYSNFTEADGHPLFGSKRENDHHLGMGFHIGQGWALFFNLVGALHDACTEPQQQVQEQQQKQEQHGETHEEVPRNSSSPASQLARAEERLPVKYIGRYDWDGQNVLREWDENVKFKERLCKDIGDGDGAAPTVRRPDDVDRPPYSTSNCAYAWMVNFMTNVWWGEEVGLALDHVLVEQAGWETVDRRPKSGWRTNLTTANLTAAGGEQQSHFTIEVRNISQPVDTFTLLSLKSYGPEWEGSELFVDISVIPGGREGGGGLAEESAARGYVVGYHAKEISVPYPHRFRLGGEGARIGDTIRATFTLTGGKNFFISGLAFCRSLIGNMPDTD